MAIKHVMADGREVSTVENITVQVNDKTRTAYDLMVAAKEDRNNAKRYESAEKR